MANVRIKDITTEATDGSARTSSYLGIDSTANGTEKITIANLFKSITITGTWTATGATCSDLGTVTTADINGGTVDGVVIGGSSAASGTFTTLTTSGALKIAAGQKLFLDGGSDTYIYEAAADNVQVFTNGVRRVAISNTTVQIESRLQPGVNATHDIGLSGERWNTIYGITANFSGELTVLGNGPHAIGGGTNNNIQWFQRGSFTSGGAGTGSSVFALGTALTAATGDTNRLSLMELDSGLTGSSITTQGATETITTIATLSVGEPNITVGTGDVVTNAATVYIENAPTEATNNYALWVASGLAKFGGTVEVANSIKADQDSTAGNTRLLVYDVDNATLERVTVGAADSGGTGFKVLRIPN